MWLWIFGILVILAVWVIWFLFPPPEPGGPELLPWWVAALITAIILTALITLWVVRRVRAARAARALEKAIAQQAQEQALNSKPEEREEIQALYRQIAEGINALKQSKLGGGKRGEQALYSLPWYAIVGPPGAGKTTALRHSGLQFPFLDPQSGGVRGVGGTRNCDWWFTNEAILLDTAGRYTTESDDRDEWIAFLEQLAKYRPEKPLNGALVAVSVSELLDATEDQIKQLSSKVRARIDEMQSTLKMTLPIYVVFTKTDLVAGFVEFFGDLKKSERGQPWGATFNLAESKANPGALFDREFDTLVEKVHARIIKRIGNERSRPSKERIYQFPLEFAAIKRNLSDFMQATFSGGSSEPILRGFYFTSGTQEGKPLDRVVGAMGRAFGLKGSVQEETEQSKEAKSYFLRDVFTSIVFPDQHLAIMSAGELRRRLMQKLAIAAAAILLAMVFVVPGVVSYFNNRELVRETARISKGVGQINWNDATSATEKVQRLDDLRNHLEKLKGYEDKGEPISYSWFMYQGTTLFGPTRDLYVGSLQEGFIKPTKEELERRVGVIKGDPYLADYNTLKTYLLLGDRERLKDPELFNFQVGRLTQVWAELLARTSGGVSEQDLKAKIQPHVKFFVELQRDGQAEMLPVNPAIVAPARERLRLADRVKAYYELFVEARNGEKIDETGPDLATNKKYPPINLKGLFEDRPEVQTILSSKSEKQGRAPAQVQGAYTVEAFKVIDKLLDEEAAKFLEREAWVVPYKDSETSAGDNIKKELKRVRSRYEDTYISQWIAFFQDIDVKIPSNNVESIGEYKVLATPEWAYQRLIQALFDNTQFYEPPKAPPVISGDGGLIDQIKQRFSRRFETSTGVRMEELEAAKEIPSKERIKRAFSTVVRFGVTPPYSPPAPLPDGSKPPEKPPVDPELNKYIKHLEKLSAEMQIIEEGPPNTKTDKATELFSTAVKDAEQMLLQMDRNGQKMLTELLMNPLRQGYSAFITGAGGAASGLWEVLVWPHYRDKIKDRYPFNLSAKRDASYSDVVAFFRPKDGVLWGFYEKYLSNFHVKQDHKFIPTAFLQGLDAKAKKGVPATPFSPLMYTCLERSDEITDALWPDGGEEPGVKFQINLKTVSPLVSDILFELDGQRRLYRNEKEFYYEFTYPGEGKRGARIEISGAAGLHEEIVRDGPWGIFRLFEMADKMTAEKDNDEEFTVQWSMSAPPVVVTMQVRPRRANHPFPLSFFRATNCPPSIGDKFKKGS
ncbi:MAG: type VI secretion system membrane subunit TssM [Polyangiaceae bacterium]